MIKDTVTIKKKKLQHEIYFYQMNYSVFHVITGTKLKIIVYNLLK